MSQSGIAGGDVYPRRFCKRDTTDGQYLAAGAGDKTAGITFKDTRRSTYIDTSGKIAASGEPFSFYTPGERCMLDIAGTVTPGARIKSDSNGKGVATTTDKDTYGAIAEANGVSGQTIPVRVVEQQDVSQ
jgi:hypothetical protein